MAMRNLKPGELKELAEERLADAKALYEAKRYAGAVYICGYAIELGLKRKMCVTLDWDDYAGDGKYKFLKTHDFEILLHFSGVEKLVIKSCLSEWSIVMKWDPEIRYSSEKQTAADTKLLIEATEALLKKL
jgi:hypothetical protein